jgi:hypothetical protein
MEQIFFLLAEISLEILAASSIPGDPKLSTMYPTHI